MVGMLAAGGGFDQIGRKHSRTWGDPADPGVIDRLSQLATAAAVTQRLRGATFGRIGGRPMGMYTDGGEHRPVDGRSSASTSRRSTSTSSCAADRRSSPAATSAAPPVAGEDTRAACTTTAAS